MALTLSIASGAPGRGLGNGSSWECMIVANGRFTVITAALAALVNACSVSKPCCVPAEQELKSIYVVRRSWHTGLAIDVQDWPVRDWPVLAHFPAARYLEFGWGEARYYQAERPNWRMALAAALRPNPSVIEVRALRVLDLQPTRDYEVVAVSLSATGFKALTDSIAATFASTAEGRTVAVPSHHAGVVWTGVEWYEGDQHVRFYHARGKFFFPRMCNRWTARRLRDGGCAIQAATVLSARRVIRDARACAAPQRQHGGDRREP